MAVVIFIIFVIVCTLVWMAIKHFLYSGMNKIDDKIKNSIDKKKGRMEETESESLADKLNDNK